MRWNHLTLLSKRSLAGERFPSGERPTVFGVLHFRQTQNLGVP